jgi:hypothetical protein
MPLWRSEAKVKEGVVIPAALHSWAFIFSFRMTSNRAEQFSGT